MNTRKILFPDVLGQLGRSEASRHMQEIRAQHLPFRKGQLPAGALGYRSPGWLCRDGSLRDSVMGEGLQSGTDREEEKPLCINGC